MALNLISLTHLGNSWNCSNTPALLERRNPTPFEWDFFLQSHFFLFLKSLYLFVIQIDMAFKLFAILQKYDFSSKSQLMNTGLADGTRCLRYCKSTIFQANHNSRWFLTSSKRVVCDTAKVRFFKQITTAGCCGGAAAGCLRYCKSTIFQANHNQMGKDL